MNARLIGLAAAALLLAGCFSFLGDNGRSGRYGYVAYDSTDTAVVRGVMRLNYESPSPDSRNRYRITGVWDFEHTAEAEGVGRMVGEGRLLGFVREDGSARISLMPGVADADAVLQGAFESEALARLEGTWAFTDWGTAHTQGRFEASQR